MHPLLATETLACNQWPWRHRSAQTSIVEAGQPRDETLNASSSHLHANAAIVTPLLSTLTLLHQTSSLLHSPTDLSTSEVELACRSFLSSLLSQVCSSAVQSLHVLPLNLPSFPLNEHPNPNQQHRRWAMQRESQ